MREARWAPRSADDEFLADVERHVARVQQDATRAIARCRGATSRTRRICALATFVVWSLAFVGLSAPVTVTKKVLGCFDEPRVAFQLSYTQGTQGMPRVERLES